PRESLKTRGAFGQPKVNRSFSALPARLKCRGAASIAGRGVPSTKMILPLPPASRFVGGDHFFSLYPVRNIHHTIARHSARHTRVIARLVPTPTSAIPKKLQRKPLIR